MLAARMTIPLRATVDDLRAAYRLLLGRDPDPGGWADWTRLVTDGVSVPAMVERFMASEEFRAGALAARSGAPRSVTRDGFTIFVDDDDASIGAVIANGIDYEPHVVRALREHLGPGRVMLDVGANVGYHTLTAAVAVGETGRVVAVEANPHNCALLARSVQASGVADRVEILPFAAGDAPGNLLLDAGAGSSNGRVERLGASGAGAGAGDMLVRAVALDDHLRDLHALHVVKIDIEGAELMALEGLDRTVSRLRPPIVFEYTPRLLEAAGATSSAILDWLGARGYTLTVLHPDSRREPAADLAAVEFIRERAAADHLDILASPAM